MSMSDFFTPPRNPFAFATLRILTECDDEEQPHESVSKIVRVIWQNMVGSLQIDFHKLPPIEKIALVTVFVDIGDIVCQHVEIDHWELITYAAALPALLDRKQLSENVSDENVDSHAKRVSGLLEVAVEWRNRLANDVVMSNLAFSRRKAVSWVVSATTRGDFNTSVCHLAGCAFTFLHALELSKQPKGK